MNTQQNDILNQHLVQKRGAAIIDGVQDTVRMDGYSNMLNKHGTKQDNSTAYRYIQESVTSDMELERLYEGNGLFTKIIDRPAEEAVKHGLDIDYGDESIAEYVEDKLDNLEFETKFATAEKWARLYGGSIIVMLVDDGGGLEEPLDWKNVRSIEELRVFERAIVQPDYSALYNFHFADSIESGKPFGEPEYYQVYSIYGYFTVHRSRCLVFRNSILPEHTTNALYRYWGIPEYVKIKKALRECITSHEDGVKLLERSVQAIYKMKNLANMLGTSDGEDKVLQRLQVIDMARGILNSIAIDNEGEDYDFKNLSLSGVKEVIDSTCNMLSAVTDIPQTILFGRSPAGMNSTGDSDMENYYNMVENIQKQNMKANARTVIELILRQGIYQGEIAAKPKYKVKFAALWSMSDSEKANVEKTKADTEKTKADTAQVYIDSGVLDPSEVRSSIAKEGGMEIEEVLSDEQLDIPDETFDYGSIPESGSVIESSGEVLSISEIDTETDEGEDVIRVVDKAEETIISIGGVEDIVSDEAGRNIRILTPSLQEMVNAEWKEAADGAEYPAAAVIIIKDGKILCASRRNSEGICGPGGHVENGEKAEEAAIREAIEEFNIEPLNLIPLGEYKASSSSYLPSMVYFTDEFIGEPEADGNEMFNAQWLSIGELRKQPLFPPFEESLKMLTELLTAESSKDTMVNDGGPGSGRYPKGSGKNPRSGKGKANKKTLPITAKEKAKVTHDINNLYHAKYKGKSHCFIRTHSNAPNSPAYYYKFRNYGFNDYDIYNKSEIK